MKSLQRRKEHAKTVKRFRIILDGLENNFSTLKVNKDDVGYRLYQRRKEIGKAKPFKITLS